MRADDPTRLTMLALPDVVLFPHTEVELELAADDCADLESLLRRHHDAGLPIATALLRPHWAPAEDGSAVFPAGTAGRLVEVRPGDDGGCLVRLRGQFRFEIEAETEGDGPLREILVQPLREPHCSDVDPAVMELREALEQTMGLLAHELGAEVQAGRDMLDVLRDELTFEPFVNRLAVRLDLSPLRKLTLLADSLPERAKNLLAILRTRRSLLGLLEPYRHLAGKAAEN